MQKLLARLQSPKTFASFIAPLLVPLLTLQAQALDVHQVEREIHRLTNAMRAEKNLAPLTAMTELDGLARKHSENMAQQGFFAHTDLQGLSPSGRMEKYLPGLFTMGSAENIAMRTVSGDAEAAVALALVTQWRHSEGHYRNIMNTSLRQLGVGVGEANGNVYATQNFANSLVMLENTRPEQVKAGAAVSLKFRFLADFPAKELTAFVNVPDKAARFYTKDGSFYTGGGPLEAIWKDPTHFELKVPTTHGKGGYRIGIGQNGAYYQTPFGFSVN